MADNYTIVKQNELKSKYDDFSFSEQMRSFIRNDLWRNKDALWTVLSGICDDTAKECYIKIQNMVSEIADIETCNIHSLKSMAKSVDAEFLVKDLREDYDKDILDLINLFSVQKEILLNTDVYLNKIVTHKSFGYLILKSRHIPTDTVSIDLLYDIKRNIEHLKKIFETNLLPLTSILDELFNEDIEIDEQLNELKDDGIDEDVILKLKDALSTITLDNILNYINAYQSNQDLSCYTKQKLFVNNSINYFYLLINIIKQNYYRDDLKFFIMPIYYDSDKNEKIDLSNLFFKIVGSLFNNEKLFYDEYVGYHFFNTIKSKIINDKLKSNYVFDKKTKKYVFNSNKQNEMTKEEFINKLTFYISYEDALNFIKTNNILKYRQEFIDFVKISSELNKELQIQNINSEKIELNILKVNYPELFPSEKQLILDVLYGNGILYYLTKKYVDECIHIRNIRNQLKDLIQQYTFIGTKRIATDIFYDFFIKNFSNKESLNYLSNDYVLQDQIITYDKNNEKFKQIEYNFDNVKRNVSDLLNGDYLSANNYYEDNKFSVNIIEYYDLTKYFNIKSDLPSIYVEGVVVDYEDVISTYLDNNYLIVSSYVKNPVYSISQIPCATFIKNYNERFWENKTLSLNQKTSILQSDSEDYIKFYSTYINDTKKISFDVFKEKYVENEIKPLLWKIWDTFALSGISENDDTSDESILYKEYIGTNIGKNKYENHLNQTFPTIASINSIENLVEASKYDDEFLIFLSKLYYANVLDKIKNETLKILKMYNDDGIPHSGWMQTYITFNGYSTKYEYSDNKLLYSIKQSELYKNNGPFVYRKLQDLLYNYYLYSDITSDFISENLLKEYSKSLLNNENIKINLMAYDFYDYYLSHENVFLSTYFDNENNFNPGKILKYEEDIYENCFTLFKNNNDITGKLFFRSYNMPISVPIMNENGLNILSIQDSSIFKNILTRIANNCIDFGFLNETMWIFGKYKDEMYYLVSFKYSFKNGYMYIDTNTFTIYSNSLDINYLKSLNDFVGTFYNEQNINFILFDCYEAYKRLSEKNIDEDASKYELLSQFDLKLILIELNTQTFTINKKEISQLYNKEKVLNLCVPMFLEFNSENLKNNERIWKTFLKDDICYITYKSLNVNNDVTLYNNYFKYKTTTISIPLLFISWNSDFKYVNINNIKDDLIFEFNDENNELIFLRNIYNLNENVNLFLSQSNEYKGLNECMLKNNRIYSKISPLNIGYEFTDDFYKLLISEIINDISDNNITYILSFEKMQNIFENNEKIKSWIERKPWLRDTINNKFITIDDVINSYKYINNLISLIKVNDNELQITHKNLRYDRTIFEETNEYYKEIPAIRNCCVEPLKVSLVFFNDSGITFINPNSIDLDITCYINDEVEKYRKVGYGNPYNKTNYLYWSGDEQNGGVESVTIDVQKYIKHKYQNAFINDTMNIVFNVCWHENSEIMTKDLYALVTWNNLIEKYPITLYGINSLECNTKSFEIIIDMKNNQLIFDQSKLYPIIKLNYKEKLMGFNGNPDIELGTMNLSNRDIESLENNKWIKYSNNLYYYKVGSSIYYLFKNINYSLISNDNESVQMFYKKIISNLFYYKKLDGEVLDLSTIALNTTFFGIGNDSNDFGIDFNYIIYLNPKYFSRIKNVKYKINSIIHEEIAQLSFLLTETEKGT